MKTPALFMLLLNFSLPSFAQSSLDTVVSLSQPAMTLKEALDTLDAQSDHTFSYSNRLPLETTITFSQTTGPLRYFLDHISQTLSIRYRALNGKILFVRQRETSQLSNKVTLSGYLTDAATGEKLIGATVYVQEQEIGTVTNNYGYYALPVPPGTYTLLFSFVGYQSESLPVLIEEGKTMNVALTTTEVQLEEVVVSAAGNVSGVQQTAISTAQVDIQTFRKMPSLLGEVDVMRSVQLLPGVTTAGEGVSGLNVRGGSIDQNLILLDEAPIFNSAHLAGIFSVFNPDAVQQVKLYKGAIPARYGGRLSSVLDVRQKEGNTQRFGGRGGIGLIGSRLLVEGPIVKDKGSFMLAGRRSYTDLLLRALGGGDFALYFYDLNTKINYSLNERNHLYLSGYFGRDVFRLTEDMGFAWGNRTSTLRWNHLFNDQLFSNFTAIYSDYTYRLDYADIGPDVEIEDLTWTSGITHYHLQSDMTYFLSSGSTVDFGASAILYRFNPGDVNIRAVTTGPEDISQQVAAEQALEAAVYVNQEKKLGDRVTLQYGLRYGTFLNVGAREVFTYENDDPSPGNAVLDTLSYQVGEIIRSYDGLEPRLSLNYTLSNQVALKASYNRLFQYIQQVSSTTITTPLDIWTPANRYTRPARVDQVAVGYFHHFRQNTIAFSTEVYYKRFQDLMDFRSGADLLLNETLETQLLHGQGRAYGLEMMLRKEQGRWTGWLSYTLSRTERQVDGINNDSYYPTNYDKPHDVSLVLNYQLTPKWNVSTNFAYMTGRPFTLPSGRFSYEGMVVPDYTQRNGARMSNYHRLDLSFNYEPPIRTERRWRNTWTLGVYNLYARRNPYAISFREANSSGQTEAVQLSFFGLIPSLTYNFIF